MVKVEPNIEIDCENERVKEIEARIRDTHTQKRVQRLLQRVLLSKWNKIQFEMNAELKSRYYRSTFSFTFCLLYEHERTELLVCLMPPSCLYFAASSWWFLNFFSSIYIGTHTRASCVASYQFGCSYLHAKNRFHILWQQFPLWNSENNHYTVACIDISHLVLYMCVWCSDRRANNHTAYSRYMPFYWNFHLQYMY